MFGALRVGWHAPRASRFDSYIRTMFMCTQGAIRAEMICFVAAYNIGGYTDSISPVRGPGLAVLFIL